MPVETVSASVRELLAWVSLGHRTYSETLEVWHTHCPRLPVWEDALAADLVEVRRRHGDGESLVVLTPAGASALRASSA